ncbi:hypothetical protein UCDDS831_g02653 [Diplodia seriata]|uniref:Uncharacterized protein n=1 Tax=Diplodia seriata TaxID=420778 RepID=A0A0G2GKH3_9PEZI|nr:hypothetical protein UCDDS831_g02653 [Diplodia seriata]
MENYISTARVQTEKEDLAPYFGIDEDGLGRQIPMYEASALMQEIEAFGDLQQTLLDFQLVNLQLAPPSGAVLFDHVATAATARATAALLLIFLL